MKQKWPLSFSIAETKLFNFMYYYIHVDYSIYKREIHNHNQITKNENNNNNNN